MRIIIAVLALAGLFAARPITSFTHAAIKTAKAR